MKQPPYEVVLESTVSGARPTYRFRTADGVCSKSSFRTAELLLLKHLWEVNLGRFLVLQANYGVVGIVLADTATDVRLAESSARATRLCKMNAAENDVTAKTSLVADAASIDESFDSVAYAPKPYTPVKLGKQRISKGLDRLEPDGRFFLAASTQTGLTRYERCLNELATAVQTITTSDGYALLEARSPRHFDAPEYVSPQIIHPVVDDTTLSLQTVPGLFSSARLDAGTRLLLETATVNDGDRVLDVCCGSGAIGVYAASNADCDIWLSDDDCLATNCAEQSLELTGVDGTVVTADCLDGVADRTFERVLCNPPTHAGDGVLSELFSEIPGVLTADGDLHLVHHRHLDLRPYLTRFDTVQRLQTGREHVVLRATP